MVAFFLKQDSPRLRTHRKLLDDGSRNSRMEYIFIGGYVYLNQAPLPDALTQAREKGTSTLSHPVKSTSWRSGRDQSHQTVVNSSVIGGTTIGQSITHWGSTCAVCLPWEQHFKALEDRSIRRQRLAVVPHHPNVLVHFQLRIPSLFTQSNYHHSFQDEILGLFRPGGIHVSLPHGRFDQQPLTLITASPSLLCQLAPPLKPAFSLQRSSFPKSQKFQTSISRNHPRSQTYLNYPRYYPSYHLDM